MKPKTNSDTTPKLYIGLGVHKEQTSVAVTDPVLFQSTFTIGIGSAKAFGSALLCLAPI